MIARVFPRRTAATPDDELAFVGGPPLFRVECEEVHVSCTFTWDFAECERLATEWHTQGYAVTVGGPAYGNPGVEFEPGRYLRQGFTITSRGCPRRCTFCLVPQREGSLRLLPIQPGWDIVDNNLLACPRNHIEAVLAMLDDQPRAARFTGGIDARLCQPWFAKRLAGMRLDILYTAFDAPSQRPSVERTIRMLRDADLRRWQVGCYVLVGQAGDSVPAAEERLAWIREIGGTPFAMFYRPPSDKRQKIPASWAGFVRQWSRPAAIFACATDAGRNRPQDAQEGTISPRYAIRAGR